MTYVEIEEAARKLPPAERRKLIAVIATSLADEAGVAGLSARDVRGLFSTRAEPPTTEQVRDGYITYLLEKYS